MAAAKGPLGNSPRDLHDSFVGDEAPTYKGGEPPKKTRGPKKVTSNTFHTSVTGATSNKRPDRPGHFRSGGFVRGRDGADPADMKAGFPKGPPAKKLLQDAKGMQKKADGGGISKSTLEDAARSMSRDTPKGEYKLLPQVGTPKGEATPLPQIGTPKGEYKLLKRGGSVKKANGGGVPMPKPDPRYSIGDEKNLSPGTAEAWKAQMGRIRSIERDGPPPGRKKGGKV